MHSNAQSDVIRDNELWVGIQLDKDINKKWSTAFTVNLRRDNDFGQYKQTYYQLALEREIGKNISALLGYRFVAKPEDKNNSNRLYTDWSFGKKLKPFAVDLRIRLQYDSETPKLFENGELLLREKIGFEYKKKKKSKLIPYVGTEFFLDLLNEWDLDKYRLYVGIKYELFKNQKINAKYVFQEANNKESDQTNIFSVEYSMKIGKKKKKKKKKDATKID